MKEYEKLAREACTWKIYPLNAAGKETEETCFNKKKYEGYILGFLKAREIAAKILLDEFRYLIASERIEEMGEREV